MKRAAMCVTLVLTDGHGWIVNPPARNTRNPWPGSPECTNSSIKKTDYFSVNRCYWEADGSGFWFSDGCRIGCKECAGTNKLDAVELVAYHRMKHPSEEDPVHGENNSHRDVKKLL